MIKLTITTEMEFDTEGDLKNFIRSRDVHRVIGFPEEIEEAWKTKSPVTFNTPRPEFGAIVKSEIAVKEQES